MAAEWRPNLALHRELVAAKKAAGGIGEKQAVADRVRALMGSAPVFSVEKDGSAVVALKPGALPARTEAVGLPTKPPIDAISDVADTSSGVWGAKLADSAGTYALTTTAVASDGAGLKIPAEIDDLQAVALSGSIAIPDPLTGAEDEPEIPAGQRDALVEPFHSRSPWVHPIGTGATYSTDSTTLSQIRSGYPVAVAPSTASNRMWCLPIAIAGPTDSEKTVRVFHSSGTRDIKLRIPDGFDAALPYPSYSGIPGAPAGNGGDGHMAVRWRDAQGNPWIDEFYGARRYSLAGADYIAKGWIRISARKHGVGYGGVSPPGGWPANARPWNGDASFVVPSGSVGWEDMTAAKTDYPGEDGVTGSVRAYGGSASAGAYTTGDFDHEDGPQHAGSVAVPHRVQAPQVTNQCNVAVWPARRNDCRPYSPTGRLKQGMLLAIPQNVDLEALGFTGNALKLGRSWQLRGIYVVDQSSVDNSQTGTFNVYANPEAPDVCSIMLAMRDNGQLQALRNLLTVVTNNRADNRGGGGTPLVDLLPEVA